MAIKQRALRKLEAAKNHMLRALGAGDATALEEACQDLTDARNLCKEGLPRQSYAAYEEVYDGLILAVQKIIEDGEEGIQEEVLALCQELLQHLEKETERETRFKKEIFFLPYKSSMWDSLESVWKAACEDKEHCNAYVMPIPYADRNPDGSVAQWHCERDQFPKYVPTLDWQQVDLKAWHPEVIFYHNPYDECNKVTSVDFHYYSRNLKECTDKLVYIPYFVLGEPEFDGKSEEKIKEIEEKYEHFVLVPGVFNAHKTIVQSENMRRLYIDVLARGTNVTDRAFWEERILGLGSPKFDKVAESKKEDYELPEEWAKIIRGRKTILYNTGLTAMLEHKEKYIEKIRSVLETFKAQKDVVLWWRPHPLLRSTFQSMHPELLGEYDEIVSTYRQEGWGIYDDTPELERAIACTDGYYGDWSSVVQLYEKTGKKVFIQNCSGEHGELRRFNGNTHFMDVAHHGGYIYFSETSFNGLFRCKEGDTKAEFLGRFPGEDLWQGDLHRKIYVQGDRLYFIPMNGHGISIYDCRDKTFEMLKVPGTKKDDVHFDQWIELEKEILLIPLNLNTPFAIFNINSEKIRILPDISIQIAGMMPLPARYEMFSVYCAAYNKGYLYLAVSSTNIVFKISLMDYEVEKKVLPGEIHLRYMSLINGTFYFTAQEHLIASWQEEDNSFQVYHMPHEPVDVNYPYLKIEAYNDNLYVISGREDRFWKLNPVTGEWTDLMENIPVGFERDMRGPLLFLGYKREGNRLVLYPRAGNGELFLNLDENEFSYRRISYRKESGNEFREDWVQTIFDSTSLLFEWDLVLTDYIQFMGGEKESHDQDEEKSVVGEIIYQRVFEGVRIS